MPIDLQSWLKELNADGVLTEADLNAVQGAFNKPQVLKRLEEGQLRQSDYSRAMNSLKQQEQATVALQNELKAWKATADKQIETANLTAKQKEQRLAQIESTVKAKATEYGLDIAEIIPPESTSTTTTTTTEHTPSPKYVSVEDWNKAQQEAAKQYPMLPALIHDLNVQHAKLFGAPLENASAIVQKALESGRPIKQVWEEDFKVADKQKEIQEADVQRRITEAVQQRESQLRSELQLPTPRPEAAQSPVLSVIKPAEQQKPGGGVAAAVAAWNEGKYRSGAA